MAFTVCHIHITYGLFLVSGYSANSACLVTNYGVFGHQLRRVWFPVQYETRCQLNPRGGPHLVAPATKCCHNTFRFAASRLNPAVIFIIIVLTCNVFQTYCVFLHSNLYYEFY